MLVLKEMMGSSKIISPKTFFPLLKKREKAKRAYYCRSEAYVDLPDKKISIKQNSVLLYDNPSKPNLVVRLDHVKEIEDRGNDTSYTIWFSDNSYLFLELA